MLVCGLILIWVLLSEWVWKLVWLGMCFYL
jgi:hypothetical protein